MTDPQGRLPISMDIEDFRKKSPDEKWDAMFMILVDLYTAGYENAESRNLKRMDCERRFKKLENRKWLDKALSFGGGVVGGVATMLGINLKS